MLEPKPETENYVITQIYTCYGKYILIQRHMHIYIYIYIYMCVCVCVFVYVCVHLYIYIYVYIYIYILMCVFLCMRVCVCVSECVAWKGLYFMLTTDGSSLNHSMGLTIEIKTGIWMYVCLRSNYLSLYLKVKTFLKQI